MYSKLIIVICLLLAARPGSLADEWSPNPYLLLDETLILSADNLKRSINRPTRHGEPIVDGVQDHNFQPYISVSHDEKTKRFRMWYNTPFTPNNAGASSLALIESRDGINWIRPHQVLKTSPIQFGASVLDEGPDFKSPAQRYKAGWYSNGGLWVAASPDGINWTDLKKGPVLMHNHDITAIDWDPIRKRYMALVSVMQSNGITWAGSRRIPHMSVSDNLLNWREPWMIIKPQTSSPLEQGETQFYCMAGTITRGELIIGLVKILRDDLNCESGLNSADLKDSGRAFAGLGYTVLAWTRDGENWNRDTEPFLDRNPQPGTWDRAHVWGDDQIIVGDELFIYYGGYKLGHKADRFATRQIGLARMPRDRYVGWAAAAKQDKVSDASEGHLRTIVRTLDADRLTVNCKVNGELRASVCDATGKVIPGFDAADCQPIEGDHLAQPVKWKESLSTLRGRPVHFVFTLKDGQIYAFELSASAAQ